VHLYAACWNEIAMIDFFFRHYDPWVERYVIFDDGSDDGSRERLAEHPRVDLRTLERTHPDSLILSLRDLYDHGWKESRGEADWVVVVNLDEHLYHPDMTRYLGDCRQAGVTAIPALGFQMVGDEVPPPHATLSETVRRGVVWQYMSKLAVFDPDAIEHVNYSPGRHVADPEGELVYPERDELLLLHFKYLGLEYIDGRQSAQRARLGERDRGYGVYRATREETAAKLSELRRKAVEPLARGIEAYEPHRRWWRPGPATLRTPGGDG
jgi:hypothetical protein